VLALTVLALLVGVAQARQPVRSEAPVIDPPSWTDTFDDPQGLAWLESAVLNNGQVTLTQMDLLGQDVASIWANTEGPNGSLYLGSDDARL